MGNGALEGVIERRETVRADGKDRDVVAVAAAGGTAVLGIVYVRDGHVVATRALPQLACAPHANPNRELPRRL